MSKFLRKYGGYVIDFTIGVLSVIAVVDFFVHDANHTAAFGIIALHAFGVIFRIRYVIKSYQQEIDKLNRQLAAEKDRKYHTPEPGS